MKALISLFLIILLSSCTQTKGELDWLLGEWERTNNKKGSITYEQWEKAGDTYIGLGYTLKDADTVFKEKLRILKMDGIWQLEVIGVNPDPTYFQFTKQTEKGFVCENPDNDFPKAIEYFSDGKKLTAIISNKNSKIHFYFK